MRKLLVFIAVALGLAGGLPATSSAGGWVVVSLDSLPAVHADEDTEVGFTVLRHGVTPEQSDDLVIVARGPGGEHRFEATQQGAAGHYVATVRLPDAGAYRWELTGEFVAADLGTFEVTGAPGGGSPWTWDVVQWGSATLAVVMAALALLDVRRSRRQRATAPAAA